MTKKFRIWDNKNNLFVKNSTSLFFCENWMIDAFTGKACDFMEVIDGDHGESFRRAENWDEKRFVVQQWTGLVDCQGKEIYEGDIVDYRYDGMNEFEKEECANLLVSPVYWEYERWRIKYSAASYAWHLMKVIGNIFETF